MKNPIVNFLVLLLSFVLSFSAMAQPVITSNPVTTAVEGELYSYTVHAEGNQTGMQYNLANKPAGMTINSNTGLITWTPATNDINAYIEIIADNGMVPSDTQKYFIFIADAPACANDIIALYRLDESSGPSYADVTGTHNASANLSPVAVTGKIDGAQLFNNSTKFLIPDNSNEWDWSSSGSFTLECWVKTTVNDRVQAYISRYNADPDFREISTSWWLGQTNTGNAALEIKDYTNHNSVLFSSKFIADGQWHHIVGVRNSTTLHNKIYVDGVEVADMSASLPGGFNCPQPTPVTLGYMKRTYTGDPEYHLNGSLDEAAFYSRALSAAEITDLYNNGQPEGHCGPGNYAPVIVSNPSLQGFTEKLYNYSFEVQDIDDEVVSLSAVSIPGWLSFSYSEGQKTASLTGTPLSLNVGQSSVTLRVSDGSSIKEQTFIITISETNHSPVVVSTPQTNNQEDIPYSYQLVVSDTDEQDVIIIEVVDKPAWLLFSKDDRTALLQGTPLNDDCGISNIDILISDGSDTIHHTFQLEVSEVNDAPEILSDAPGEVNAGELYTYIFLADDEDSENLIMTAITKPEWLSFSSQTGLLYGTAPQTAHGSVLVTLRVSDGNLYSDQYIVININSIVPVQTAEISDIKIYPVPVKETLYFDFSKSNGDLDIEILNINGIKVRSMVINSIQQPYEISVSDLSEGIYILKVRNSSFTGSVKFTISKY